MGNESLVLFADFVNQEKAVYMGEGCGAVDMCGCESDYDYDYDDEY